MSADRPDPRPQRRRRVSGPTALPGGRAGRPERRWPAVSRLDRVTLQLGVAVAVVIALCSYAVSATCLYALGVQAGYSRWQAAAVPVVADGPAIYGMFRIVSRSRRGAKGAGYGWLLVIAGPRPPSAATSPTPNADLVAQVIAAAIPLAVLAMLEGLKGDASEVTRLPQARPDLRPAGPPRPAGPRHHHRPPPGHLATPTADVAERDGSGRRVDRPSAARRRGPPAAAGRLCPGPARRQPWTARTLAEAAGCGRSSAAAFLQLQRSGGEAP